MTTPAPSPVRYVRRPPYFAMRVIRFLGKNSIAFEIGVGAASVITQVAVMEDLTGYSRPVFLSNDSLAARCGAGSFSTAREWRRKAVESGWLVYREGERRHVGTYFVAIPEAWRERFERDRNEGESQYAGAEERPPTRPANPVPVAKPTEKPKPAQTDAEGFDRFWEAYPKQENESQARRAYNRLRPDAATLQAMLDGIAHQRTWASRMNEFPRYWPQPAVWLRDRRWTDRQTNPPKPEENGDGLPDQQRNRRVGGNAPRSRKVRDG